jgi:hypothetical protein
MIDQLAILAALCVGIAFLAGMSAHQWWIDFINSRTSKGDRPASDIEMGKKAR